MYIRYIIYAIHEWGLYEMCLECTRFYTIHRSIIESPSSPITQQQQNNNKVRKTSIVLPHSYNSGIWEDETGEFP